MDDLILGFRFGVFFFAGGVVPNPLDIRFQKDAGLSGEVTTMTHVEGGQNLYTHRLPSRVDYTNLILERGMVVGSPLNLEFNAALSLFKFAPSNVLVTLFGEDQTPLAGWLFVKAYPVKWSTSDLDGQVNSFVIVSLEIGYTLMQMLRV